MRRPIAMLLCTMLVANFASARGKKKEPEPSPLDLYVQEASTARPSVETGSGSLWTGRSPFSDLARDLRASAVNDLVTIQVAERASALASGDLKSSRQSSLKANIASLAGPKSPTGALGSLADLGSSSSVDGSATTSRQTNVSTTLSARVTHVLPNGYLVLEGTKEVLLNSERQTVTVRGVARPADLSGGNIIRSDRLAQLEIRVNGKGVVGDAIRRPFFLYRLLLGILPL